MCREILRGAHREHRTEIAAHRGTAALVIMWYVARRQGILVSCLMCSYGNVMVRDVGYGAHSGVG